MDPKAEIKARLPIEELVGQYCELHRKGRNFVCLCPFHNDTHPSFLVSPDKGIAYCFACNTGGDIFSFYQSIESVDFPQAIKDLAERTGVELPREAMPRGPKKDEKERMKECLAAAEEFFFDRLTKNPKAMEYLTSRGVDNALRTKFRIGYAPDSFSETYDFLLKKGFSQSEILGAGLAVQKDLSDSGMYDRFRHRLMFPIHDPQGTVIGFGGRALKEDDAKYVNSPEGPLYHKSSVLFGLSHARDAIRSSKNVVLVEGYFDVIAAHKAGIENVVAVSGTAFTADHAKLLHRYADQSILCLDQDRAGKEAAVRAFLTLAPTGMRVHAVSIPAKDPDEFVQRDAAAFGDVIAQGGSPFIDAVLADLTADPSIDTPAGKRAAIEKLGPLLSALPGEVEREAYIGRIAMTVGLTAGAVLADLQRMQKAERRGVASRTNAPAPVEKTPFTRGELCIGLALAYPACRDAFADLLPPVDTAWKTVHDALFTQETEVPPLDALDLPSAMRDRLMILSLFCEDNFSTWSEMTARREIRKLVIATNREIISAKQRIIIRKLKEARQSGRRDEELQLLTQYNQALKLMHMAS